MKPQQITDYLNSFENISQTDKDLLHIKIMSVYLTGQIDGANEFRQLYHKVKEDTNNRIKVLQTEKMERAYYPEGLE